MCLQGRPFRPYFLDPGNRGENTLGQILERNCFEKAELGFRQNFLQGSFWLSVICIDLQQLRSDSRREGRDGVGKGFR